MRTRERMVGSTLWRDGAHRIQMVRGAGSSISLSSTFVARSAMRPMSLTMTTRHGPVDGICSDESTKARTSSMGMATLSVARTVTSGEVPAITSRQDEQVPSP